MNESSATWQELGFQPLVERVPRLPWGYQRPKFTFRGVVPPRPVAESALLAKFRTREYLERPIGGSPWSEGLMTVEYESMIVDRGDAGDLRVLTPP